MDGWIITIVHLFTKNILGMLIKRFCMLGVLPQISSISQALVRSSSWKKLVWSPEHGNMMKDVPLNLN